MDHQIMVFVLMFFITCWFNISAAHENNRYNLPNPMWNSTVTDQLKHKLLLHYDKFARPMQHNLTTTVKIGIRVNHIAVNELDNTFSVYGLLNMVWKDEKLRWNKSEYGGFDTLHVAGHEIWQPDIVPYYSADSSTSEHYGNTNCLVDDKGTVLCIPPFHFIVFCELNFRYWPFDTQTCMTKLASWTHHGNLINVELDTIFQIDLFIKKSEWRLIGWSSEMKLNKYTCCPEVYPEVSFNFTVHRKSPLYKVVIFTPTFTMIAVTLVAFLLPPEAGEKLILNICAIIISLIFLLYFSQKCPVMGDHTPFIILFYTNSLYVISFCTMVSVAVIWISRNDHQVDLPWILKHALTGWFGKSLGLSHYITQTSTHRSRVTVSRSSVVSRNNLTLDLDLSRYYINEDRPTRRSFSNRHHDWILLAAAIDRLFFIFYLLVFTILAAKCFREYYLAKGLYIK